MRHENIISLLGVYYEDRSAENILPMLVMESVQCDLHQYLNNHNYTSWNENFIIMQGISSGLVYLHDAKNIVHNSISTTSILLTESLVVKLSNFQSAVNVYPANKFVFSHSSDILQFGKVISNMLSVRHSDAAISEDEQSFTHVMRTIVKLCSNEILEYRSTSNDILQILRKYKWYGEYIDAYSRIFLIQTSLVQIILLSGQP